MKAERRTLARGRTAAALLATSLLAAACGGGGDASTDTGSTAGDGAGSDELDVSDWDSVLAEADGQTVDWFMWGGDEALNEHVTGLVSDLVAEHGVTIEQVRLTDTVEAVNTVLGEKQAGRDEDGAVDLIWINGENFATGVQADLWYCGWAEDLPNAELVPWDEDAINTDFGTPVNGCEAPWNRAQSVVVYDTEAIPDGFASVDDLLAFIEDDPGRFAYPAPPDFTGSMAVRTLLYGFAGGADQIPPAFDEQRFERVTDGFWDQLNDLEDDLWRGGETYPQSQQEVVDLFSNGQIDAYFTYEVAEVVTNVANSNYPDTTRARPLEDGGSIGNTNYVTIPYNAPDKAGALVVANVLQSVEAQLDKAQIGYAPVLDVTLTERADEFAIQSDAVPGYDVLLGRASPELSSAWIQALDDAWTEEVLQQ